MSFPGENYVVTKERKEERFSAAPLGPWHAPLCVSLGVTTAYYFSYFFNGRLSQLIGSSLVSGVVSLVADHSVPFFLRHLNT